MQEDLLKICLILLAVNLAALLLFGLDKLLAVRRRRRIPEAALLTWCFLCGSLGGLLGMEVFRHKTNPRRHPAFVWGVPAMLLAQLAAAFWLLRFLGGA